MKILIILSLLLARTSFAFDFPWVTKLPSHNLLANRNPTLFSPNQLVIALGLSASNQKMVSALCVLNNRVENIGLFEYGKWSFKGCLKLNVEGKSYQSFVPILRKLRPFLDEQYQPQDSYIANLVDRFFPTVNSIDYRVYFFESFIKFSLGGDNEEVVLIPLDKSDSISLITRAEQEEVFSMKSLPYAWLSKLIKE